MSENKCAQDSRTAVHVNTRSMAAGDAGVASHATAFSFALPVQLTATTGLSGPRHPSRSVVVHELPEARVLVESTVEEKQHEGDAWQQTHDEGAQLQRNAVCCAVEDGTGRGLETERATVAILTVADETSLSVDALAAGTADVAVVALVEVGLTKLS